MIDNLVYAIPTGIMFIFLVILFLLYLKNQEKYDRDTKRLQNEINKVVSQKKASEVRLGLIGEHMAPFLNGWPWDPRQFRFLGNPVDGIQYNDDEILFVEIKTGNARLSASQKKTKELVKAGKVSFVTFRISTDGTKLIKEEVETDEC